MVTGLIEGKVVRRTVQDGSVHVLNFTQVEVFLWDLNLLWFTINRENGHLPILHPYKGFADMQPAQGPNYFEKCVERGPERRADLGETTPPYTPSVQ